MKELIEIRIDELNKLREDLIAKQKIDLARIEVRIEELNNMLDNQSDEEIIPTTLNVSEIANQKINSDILNKQSTNIPPVVEQIIEAVPEKVVKEPEIIIETPEIKVEADKVEVKPTPEPKIVEPVKPVEVDSGKASQDDIEAMLNAAQAEPSPSTATNVVEEPKIEAVKPVMMDNEKDSAKVCQDDIEALLNSMG